MRTSLQWGTVALAAALLGAAEPPAFKTFKARDAAAAYDKEMRRAEEDYARRTSAARKAYRDALTIAKNVAMKNGDLEEANLMQAQLEQLAEELKSPPRAGRREPLLVIHSAWYGAGEKWADVTDIVRSHAQDGVLVEAYKGVPDPAVGVHKKLIIEGTYGGKAFYLSDGEGHRLTFGEPPPGEKGAGK